MTDIDLAEIKRLAEAASSGSWQWAVGPALASMEAEDAAFVQAVSPAVVLALLSRLDAAEQGRDRLRVVATEYRDAVIEGSKSLTDDTVVGRAWERVRDRLQRAKDALDAALRAPEPKEPT